MSKIATAICDCCRWPFPVLAAGLCPNCQRHAEIVEHLRLGQAQLSEAESMGRALALVPAVIAWREAEAAAERARREMQNTFWETCYGAGVF